MQAKQNAAKLRMLYNAKKQQLADIIAKDLQDDPALEISRNLSVAHAQAKDRFHVAMNKLREENLNKALIQHEIQERIKEVRNAEKKRAALIASLPPPKDILDEESLKKPKPADEALVLVYDLEARNTIHTQNVPSKIVVKNEKVDDEKEIEHNKPQNANISAYEEEQRTQAVERINALRASENLIKADVRGRQAMKKERVRQYYRALLDRLDEIKRNETLLRRNQLYSGNVENSHVPISGHLDDSAVNRRMEKVFEVFITSF
ncbi:unnamed protein product [Schistosoma turkestanicum]|nr:unnamed protein product [Schistosoma turkestanicum]